MFSILSLVEIIALNLPPLLSLDLTFLGSIELTVGGGGEEKKCLLCYFYCSSFSDAINLQFSSIVLFSLVCHRNKQSCVFSLLKYYFNCRFIFIPRDRAINSIRCHSLKTCQIGTGDMAASHTRRWSCLLFSA